MGVDDVLEDERLGVAVIALDRWGRAVLLERTAGACVPAAPIARGEAPDAAALRLFDTLAQMTLDQLRFFRVFRGPDLPGLPWRELHVYFDDPDPDPQFLEPPPEGRWRLLGPGELEAACVLPWAGALLRRFFESPAYRALFH